MERRSIVRVWWQSTVRVVATSTEIITNTARLLLLPFLELLKRPGGVTILQFGRFFDSKNGSVVSFSLRLVGCLLLVDLFVSSFFSQFSKSDFFDFNKFFSFNFKPIIYGISKVKESKSTKLVVETQITIASHQFPTTVT